jgi:hypothetical protein
MSARPPEILSLTVEHRRGPDDPCPLVIKVGHELMPGGDQNLWVSNLFVYALRLLVTDWEGLYASEILGHMVSRCRCRPVESDPDTPEFNAEDKALNEFLAAAERYHNAWLERQDGEARAE